MTRKERELVSIVENAHNPAQMLDIILAFAQTLLETQQSATTRPDAPA